MDYVSVKARFLFFNGQTRYTVEFAYGLMCWYIFNEEETTGAVYQKKINPKKTHSPTRNAASDILEEYLNQ